MIRVFPSFEHSAGCVRKPADNFRTFVWRLFAPDNSWHKCHLYVEQNIGFARFYIVCEEVALAPLKSPLIVCGLPDTPVDCQSVAKTRNLMPDAARKKYSHFALKNNSRSCIRSLFRSFVLHTTVRDHVSPTTAVRRLPLLRAADTAAALPLLLRAP